MDAIELRVRTRDATEAARATVPPRAAAVGELLERSWLHERWLLLGHSAIIVHEGGGHPLPEGSRLVLHESGDRADLLRAGLPHLSFPPRALADLLEGGVTWRSEYSVIPHAERDSPPGAWSVALRYRARTGSWRRTVTTRLSIWHRRAPPAEAARLRLAVDLIALPYLSDEGRRVLRREAADVGVPIRWRIEVADETLAGRTAFPVLEGQVLGQKAVRVAESVLTHGAPRYGPFVHDAGGLLVARGMLARLGVGPERPGALDLANRTPFHLYVLADGASFCRVGPHSEIRMDGLPPGYYRLYARSRHGTFAWGPRDQYVPGSMTVTLP
jgi:hypothetical protein